MNLHDPHAPMHGYVELYDTEAPGATLAPGASALPSHYAPRVAGYGVGPMLPEAQIARVTPSHWRWRNARTVTVTLKNGTDYRALRVTSNVDGGRTVTPFFVGYWAVEFLGLPLTLGSES